MKKLSIIAILLTSFIYFSCNSFDDILNPDKDKDEKASISFVINDIPASVSKLIAVLSRENFSDKIIQVPIQSDSTKLTFEEVPVGIWHLKVDALDASS
ncbi:hypothetical protein GF406_26980, partial [candidate division KSB1 bacterium]|nr:hypothetical protein [candidate division KSB1 bacterium]